MKAIEYLSNDILEDSFLRSFYPFRFIQTILGSSRVDARDRFVTVPTVPQKIYTVICLVVCFFMYSSSVIYYFNVFSKFTNIYYLTITSVYLHYSIYVCSVINARFFNNEANVKFYIQLQKLDRKLKIDKNTYLNDRTFLANLVTVATMLLILVILFASAFFNENVTDTLTFGGFLWAQLCSSLEWLYCSNLLLYFYIRLRYINAIIINHLEGTDNVQAVSMEKYILPTTRVLRYMASGAHMDFTSIDIDVYLTDLCEGLVRFQNLYRFQIFLFCFKFISGILMNFEYGLLALQINILRLTESIVLITITLLDLSIIIFICVRSEAFSREINNTKYLCITVLSRYYDGPLRKKAVKMLKLIKEKPPRISVYDMWYMDASTMIKIINLVTTLMVTLLQFALL